jgi:hypothetical protein
MKKEYDYKVGFFGGIKVDPESIMKEKYKMAKETTGAITKAIEALEQCIDAFDMLDALKGTNNANTLIYQDAVEALAELKAFKAEVQRIRESCNDILNCSECIDIASLTRIGLAE